MASTSSSPRRGSGISIRVASHADVQALTGLINAAFVVERVVFDGDRVDGNEICSYMQKGTFLVAEENSDLVGCVYLELREDRGYLGLLSVDPPRQGSGLGRQLVIAAEDFACKAGAHRMDLRVISARAELLPFYRKVGYEETGTAPFAPGLKTKIPSHYILMSKPLR